jgi:hypothetical protein
MDCFETCEDCWEPVNIMVMIVKETIDGNCIYCPKCVQRHKQLERDAETLIKKWGLDITLRDEPKQFKKKPKPAKVTKPKEQNV